MRRVVAAVVVVLFAAGMIVVLAGVLSSDPAGCTWDQSTTGAHRQALADLGDTAVRALTVGSPVLGDSTVERRDELDEVAPFAPMACLDLAMTLDADSQAATSHGRGYAARIRVVVLSSWKALDRYVDERSFVAGREIDTHPGNFFEGAPSPYGSRVESVDGRDGWDLYCLLAGPASGCNDWNLLARSESCRAIVVDVTLTPQGDLDEEEAMATLVPVVERTLDDADAALKEVPCSVYGGEPSGKTWRPAR